MQPLHGFVARRLVGAEQHCVLQRHRVFLSSLRVSAGVAQPLDKLSGQVRCHEPRQRKHRRVDAQQSRQPLVGLHRGGVARSGTRGGRCSGRRARRARAGLAGVRAVRAGHLAWQTEAVVGGSGAQLKRDGKRAAMRD